jgi:Asp-tRNA(Asn)/Glu-tRNA(Gln) amidotransferase A subunit family amidase
MILWMCFSCASQDIYALKGKKTTFGYVAWKDQVMDEDSSIVKACRDAGGMFLDNDC